MLIVRQSTARTMMIGPVLDADGVAVTNCVVSDFEGSVNGGDPAALNGSATLTHRGVGFYSLALTATDLATVGSFEVTINDTVNACPMKELTVIEEAVYDAMFAASATGYQVPIWANAGSTVSLSATTVATVTTTGTATNLTNAPGAGDFTTTMKTSIGTAVAASAVASVTGNVGGNVTGSVGSVVGAVGSVTGAVGSVTGAVGSVTGNVGGTVAGVTPATNAQVVSAAAAVPAAVLAAAASDPIASNTKEVNGVPIGGAGTEGNPFGPA